MAASLQLLSSTGSPQGCVLSPLLYILYTNDCCSQSENRHIVKFANDSVIVSLLEDNESGHGPVLDDFVAWCDDAYLQLNPIKTEQMSVEFRRKSPVSTQTSIKGEIKESVESYKYFGIIPKHVVVRFAGCHILFGVGCHMLVYAYSVIYLVLSSFKIAK